ncbi:MAG: GDSL-type esterase/lipase family protein [Paracoccaceae bacterium]
MSFIGLSLGLEPYSQNAHSISSSFDHAAAILGARSGFAISFADRFMRVRDAANPANDFDGDPELLLTKFGADPYLYDPQKGLLVAANRDFSVALQTSLFPFDPAAIHVYAEYECLTADSTAQRYLLFCDNAGTDRFACYTTSGLGFRFVTGDGTAANTDIAPSLPAPGAVQRAFFGADTNGKTFIDEGGVIADEATQLAASAPTHVGIGGYPDQVLRVLDGYIREIVVICEPLARETRLTLDPVSKLFAAEGDSHTFNTSYGLAAGQFYPDVVAASRTRTVARNAGGSGDSTAEMVAQLPSFLALGAPDVASIYAGSNDDPMTVLASPAPTQTAFAVSDPVRLGVDGWITVGGETVQVAAVSGSLVTLAAPLAAAPPAGAQVDIATRDNLEHWISAVRAAGCSKVLVIGSHYLNFAAGGDTPTAEQPLRAATRAVQQAAAAAQSAVYVDTYGFMRDRILAGDPAQGDDLSIHVAVGNTHLNAVGEQMLADAVSAKLTALGWL